MGGDLLFYRKNIEPNSDIVEMKIWNVPLSKYKPHGIKYSLVYIKRGKRLIGYDNAEMKGDHRHYDGKEFVYHFTDVETLIKDFHEDVARLRRGEL